MKYEFVGCGGVLAPAFAGDAGAQLGLRGLYLASLPTNEGAVIRGLYSRQGSSLHTWRCTVGWLLESKVCVHMAREGGLSEL